MPPVGWFARPWVQLATAEWELVLGLWLLSRAMPRIAWAAAVGTFAAFAGVSGYLGWVGVASCGCFGVIHASPWHAFSADVAVLLLLAVTRPTRGDGVAGSWDGTAAAWTLGTVAVVLTAVTAFGIYQYDSPDTALARLRGEAVVVEGAPIDFGTAAPGDRIESVVRARNLSDHPIRLIGGTSDCSCLSTEGLPVTIGPGEAAEVPVTLVVPRSADGRFQRSVEFLTDDPRVGRVRFAAHCLARPPDHP